MRWARLASGNCFSERNGPKLNRWHLLASAPVFSPADGTHLLLLFVGVARSPRRSLPPLSRALNLAKTEDEI